MLSASVPQTLRNTISNKIEDSISLNKLSKNIAVDVYTIDNINLVSWIFGELRDYYEVYPAVIIFITHSIARILNINFELNIQYEPGN